MIETAPLELIEESRLDIKRKVSAYIERSEELFQKSFKQIDVKFDLTGRAAGMYKVANGNRVIRFNPHHFAKYPKENWQETIPHEVAHYITDQVYGLRNIRPHGKQWKELMHHFGVEPQRTFSYSLDGIPHRKQKLYPYRCACNQFDLTSRRHNMIQRGKADYSCKICGMKLKFINSI